MDEIKRIDLSKQKNEIDKIDEIDEIPPLDIGEPIMPIRDIPDNIRILINIIDEISSDDMELEYLIDTIDDYIYNKLIIITINNNNKKEISDWIKNLTTLLTNIRQGGRGYNDSIELLKNYSYLKKNKNIYNKLFKLLYIVYGKK